MRAVNKEEDIRNGLATLRNFQGGVCAFSGLNQWENEKTIEKVLDKFASGVLQYAMKDQDPQ